MDDVYSRERRLEVRIAVGLLLVVAAWALAQTARQDGRSERQGPRAQPALSASPGTPDPPPGAPQEPAEGPDRGIGAPEPEIGPLRASQEPDPTPQAGTVTVESLTGALRGRVALGSRSVAVRHCRRAPGGCEARLASFARAMIESGEIYQLDPVLLAAIAVRESGLNPAAEGTAVGEGGVMQLHPRGVGSRSRFVRDDRYRARCLRREPGACQEEVIALGAEHLAQWIERCDSVDAALGGYNQGRCGETTYARRVQHEREKLRGLL